MYARRANIEQKITAGYGRPFLLVLLKIFGALPETARPSDKMQILIASPYLSNCG
jgi:hypothetical protein